MSARILASIARLRPHAFLRAALSAASEVASEQPSPSSAGGMMRNEIRSVAHDLRSSLQGGGLALVIVGALVTAFWQLMQTMRERVSEVRCPEAACLLFLLPSLSFTFLHLPTTRCCAHLSPLSLSHPSLSRSQLLYSSVTIKGSEEGFNWLLDYLSKQRDIGDQRYACLP